MFLSIDATIRFSTAISSNDSSRSCSIDVRNRDFTRLRTEKVRSAVRELTGIATAIA